MMVRFATTCDVGKRAAYPCKARSLEYTTWPTCRVCHADVCPQHAAPGTLEEDKGFDGQRTVVCVQCTEEPS